MPSMRVRTSVAAAAQNVSALSGQQYEYLTFNSLVEFAVVGQDLLNFTPTAVIFSGTDLLQQGSPINAKVLGAGGGLNVVYPDDFLLNDTSMRGDRIGVILTNPGTAAGVVDTVVRITPV